MYQVVLLQICLFLQCWEAGCLSRGPAGAVGAEGVGVRLDGAFKLWHLHVRSVAYKLGTFQEQRPRRWRSELLNFKRRDYIPFPMLPENSHDHTWVLIISLGFLTDAMLQKQGWWDVDGRLVMVENREKTVKKMKGDSADKQNYHWKTSENVCVIISVYLKVWDPANMFDTNTLSEVLHMWSDIICAILNLKADPRGAWGAHNLRFGLGPILF